MRSLIPSRNSPYMGFGLVIGFNLLCLHRSFPGDESQQCPLLPCPRSYQLATASQLTHCCNCPTYNNSARTAHKTAFLCCCIHCCVRICWNAHVIATQPFPSNGCCCLQSHLLRGRCLATGLHATILFSSADIIKKVV
jgi:hypothetical protein